MAQTLIRKGQLNMTELLNFFYPVGTIYHTTSTDLDTTTTGSDQAHNNLQPYIVVYRYRRTA